MSLFSALKLYQKLYTDVAKLYSKRAFIAQFEIAAANAAATDVDGVLVATPHITINTPATGVVKAATAITDTLTITSTNDLGTSSNDLNVLLTTAADDNLAATKTDGTKTINIALANTTAAKNTAALIQAAIRALTTVGGIAVGAVVCSAQGNWNTAAIETGETGSVAFNGGTTAANKVITTGISNPKTPRNITMTAAGTAGDVKAVQAIITGTNYADEVITETLPAFTVNQLGIVSGAKAFKTVSKIEIPAMDGAGVTIAVGWGDILGIPYILTRQAVLKAYQNNTADTIAAQTVGATLELNTVTLTTALSGVLVEIDLIV